MEKVSKRCISCERELPIALYYDNRNVPGFPARYKMSRCAGCDNLKSNRVTRYVTREPAERQAALIAEVDARNARRLAKLGLHYKTANVVQGEGRQPESRQVRRQRERRAAKRARSLESLAKFLHRKVEVNSKSKSIPKKGKGNIGLTPDHIKALLIAQDNCCAYCSGEIYGKHEYSVNRIDSSKPYAPGNVNIMHVRCNIAIGREKFEEIDTMSANRVLKLVSVRAPELVEPLRAALLSCPLPRGAPLAA